MMIQNKLFTVSILTAATTAACFFGCSSSPDSSGSNSGTGPTGSSGGSGSGSGGSSSSSSGTGQNTGGDGGACLPNANVSTSSLPPYVTVVGMNGSCTSMQISGFLSACVAQGATANNCSMWASANAMCAGCIVQGTDAGATETGAIIFSAMGSPVSGNVPGCIALADPSAGPACANQLEPLMQCIALACPNCGDQTSFSSCEKAARASGGVCGALSSAAQSPCAAELGSNGVGVTKCGYGTSNELVDVITVICGTSQ